MGNKWDSGKDVFTIEDFKEHKKKKNSKGKNVLSSFGKMVVDKFSDKIPILPRNLKSGRRMKAYTTILDGYYGMMEMIHDRNRDTFRTISEVHRCCLHIGISIVAQKLMSGDAKSISNLTILKQQEMILKLSTELDIFTDHYSQLFGTFRRGLIDAGELKKYETELLASAPESIREHIRHKIRQIQSGANVYNLYETEHWGGNRK